MHRVQVFPPTSGVYASIELEGDLEIELRGTKNPELCRCICSIPAKNGDKASSVNHAYTLLSEKFEKHRMTHTGNVFEQVYAQNENQQWVQLKVLRDGVYRQFEYELICLCKEWWRKEANGNQRIWSCIDINSEKIYVLYEITDKSVIISERYYEDRTEALGRLKRKGFKKFDHDDFLKAINPPIPPYTKPGGNEVRFFFEFNESGMCETSYGGDAQ